MGTKAIALLSALCVASCRDVDHDRPPLMPPAFEVEQAALLDKYGRPDLAEAHLLVALTHHAGAPTDLAAHSALARVREKRGDLRGAAKALEDALAIAKARDAVATAPQGAPELDVDPRELQLRLARIALDLGDYADAELAYDHALAATIEPHLRDQIRVEHIDLLRRSGELETRLAAWQRAAAADPPDDEALRSLAAWFGPEVGRPADARPAANRDLVPVLAKLAKLHPDDAELRERLLHAYEAAGQQAAAVALAQAPVNRVLCPQGLPPAQPPELVEARVREVQSLERMGKRAEAFIATEQLVALARKPELAVAAYTAAARLYYPLDREDLASKAILEAEHAARSAEDHRLVEITKAFGLERTQRTGALSELYQAWERSDDECLHAEATRNLAPWRALAAASKTKASVP